jgi:hypothetical protein
LIERRERHEKDQSAERSLGCGGRYCHENRSA